MTHVVLGIPEVPLDLIDAFKKQDVATVHEAMDRTGALDRNIKPLCLGIKMCGRALTVKTHLGDNLMLHKALSMAKKGDVIIADTGMCLEAASWGDIMTVQAKENGVSGLVLNGSVRDSAILRKSGFPIFCGGVSVKGLMKDSLGTVNHQICCGGVTVNPGDIVLGDDDGVVVIPLERANEVLKAVHARAERERDMIERIRAGEKMYDIMGFTKIFAQLGCIEK